MDQNILNGMLIGQVVLCVLLVISILMQNRAEGLGQMFGGGGEIFRTRRGFENFLYYATIVLAVLVAVMSIVIVKFTQ